MADVEKGILNRGVAWGFTLLGLAACAAPEATGPTGPTLASTPAATSSAEPGAGPAPVNPSGSPSPDSPATPATIPALRGGRETRQLWEAYPWGPDDGLACPAPGYSPGTEKDPAGPGIVVVVGDSLIRESRGAIAEALSRVGFDVVFVCWGGKTLLWGLEQVAVLRSLDLMPSCLVINLGTNDLKGTTAQGLADAVPMGIVSERLTNLLREVSDVPDVFVVDLAAQLSSAPATMAEVGEAPEVWREAVSQTGVGAVIPWSGGATQGGLIGSDGIHDSANGQIARAEIITDYVVRDCMP